MASLPLEGIRILDFGRFWAGPALGLILAYLGAEVVKVESCSNPDPLRIYPRGLLPKGELGQQSWNRSGLVNERNRNKYGIAVDLTLTEGQEIFRQLVGKSDVVIENFSLSAADKLGLNYPMLKELNPQIILLSLRSRGSNGPDRNNVSFGPTLEAVSGLLSMTGYVNEIYEFASQGLPDVLSANLCAGLVIAALYYRRRTGVGLHIDFSQLEAASCVIGEAFLAFFMNGQILGPMGNRHPFRAPHGCYKCQGDDEWVTLSIFSDREWEALCSTIGNPELAQDSRFADVLTRYENQHELDRIIEEWTKQKPACDIMTKLQQAGIAAGAVLKPKDLFNDPHFVQRKFFQPHLQPGVGTYQHPRLPMCFSQFELSVRLPAPGLGEHNHYILNRWLGMSASDIAQLERDGVIGTEPKINRR